MRGTLGFTTGGEGEPEAGASDCTAGAAVGWLGGDEVWPFWPFV